MRIIDADALLKKAHNYYPSIDHYCCSRKAVDTKDITEAPTIDAKPVKHGEIIETIENGKMKRVFSCCNADCTRLTMWINPNYCPNCGAKMDGERRTDATDCR